MGNLDTHDGDEPERAEGYEVGYGKPPRHSRWPKGTSGNPAGRNKGARGLKTDLDAELRSSLSIRINGKTVTATTQRLMLRTLAARAASGDVRASRVVLDLILQVFGAGDRGGDGEKLSANDQMLLDRFLAANIACEPVAPRQLDEGPDKPSSRRPNDPSEDDRPVEQL